MKAKNQVIAGDYTDCSVEVINGQVKILNARGPKRHVNLIIKILSIHI